MTAPLWSEFLSTLTFLLYVLFYYKYCLGFCLKLSIISTVRSRCCVSKNYKYCLSFILFANVFFCTKSNVFFESWLWCTKRDHILLISCPFVGILVSFILKMTTIISVRFQTCEKNYYTYSFYYKYCLEIFLKLSIISTIQSQSQESYRL